MSTNAQKLGIQADTSVAFDGIPVADARLLVGDLPDAVNVTERSGGGVVDQLILVAEGLADLTPMLDGVWALVAPGGRLWVWYRKGASRSTAQDGTAPLHRDTLQALLAQHGMDGVTLISIDDTWSSMRVKQVK